MITIFPSLKCNLSCKHCYMPNKKDEVMEIETDREVANQEPLIPVVFVIAPCTLHAIQTSDYIDVVNDNEYVGRDEKEVITTDCSYRVINIEETAEMLVFTLEPLNYLN